ATGITSAQLYSTASYQAHDLRGIGLMFGNLGSANFAGQDLRNANFAGANTADFDFTGADIRGMRFDKLWIDIPLGGSTYKESIGSGIAPSQLYSTASYQIGDLSGINFGYNSLAGVNLAGQKIENADFNQSDLTGADFRGATLTNGKFRGARL